MASERPSSNVTRRRAWELVSSWRSTTSTARTGSPSAPDSQSAVRSSAVVGQMWSVLIGRVPRVRRRAARRRRRRRARRGRPTRAARRWRRPASSMPACRSPSSAKRAGHGRHREVAGSTSSISSHVIGVDTVAVGHAPHRVGRGHRVVAGVLVVVDEQRRPDRGPCATTSSSPSAGARRSTSRAKASAARRTSREAVRRARCARRRAARCRPTSSASRRRRARRAPRARRGRRAAPRSSGQSGIGSRSMRHSSGCSTSARREFHGWNSTVDICTAQITWASSVTHSSSACWP